MTADPSATSTAPEILLMLWFCACFRVMLPSPAGCVLPAERRVRRCTKGVHFLFGEQAVVTGERRVATGELRSEKRLRSRPLRGIGLHSSQIGTRVASLSG